MELKHRTTGGLIVSDGLLIVPYGIETRLAAGMLLCLSPSFNRTLWN